MQDASQVLAAEQAFFSSLIHSSLPDLKEVLAEDFTLVDLSGSLLDKSSLMAATGAGQLKFESIQVLESRVRFYESTAVVIGRTEMSGSFGGAPFSAKSRYTHIYVCEEGAWHLAAAQGTQIQAG